MSDEEQLKPKAIAADIARELREHPERWFKGNMAATADGKELDSANETGAVCWCLEGHINKRFHTVILANESWYRAREAVYEAFRKELGRRLIYQWNDAENRGVADVIELCEKVAAS